MSADEKLEILREMRDRQKEMLDLQREQFDFIKIQYDRAEAIQDKAEQIQDRAHKSIKIIMPLIGLAVLILILLMVIR